MLLHAIELQDVGRFGKFRAALSGQQVGVLGPNGAGKSTILSAIHYAVTGDLARLGGKGDAVNTLRHSQTETPYVRLDFFPDGRPVGDPAVVVRKLPADGKDGTRRLAHGDRTWTAQADLTAKFEAWTGLSIKALSEFVFVPQGGLDHVVRAPAPRRAEILQRVFGVAHAERVCKIAQERLAALPAPADASVLATLRSRAAESLARAAEAERAVGAVTIPAGETEAVALVARWRQAELAHQAVEAARAALSQIEAVVPVPPSDPRPSLADITLAERALEHARGYRSRAQAALDAGTYAEACWVKVTAWVARPDKAYHPGPDPGPSAELLALRERKFTLSVVATAPPGEVGVCPVCAGRLSPDAADAHTAAEALRRLEELEAAYAVDVQKRTAAIDRCAAAVREEEQLRRLAQDAQARARRLGEAVGPGPTISDTEAEAFLSTARHAAGQWAAYDRSVPDHAARVSEARRTLHALPTPPRVPDVDARNAQDLIDRAALCRADREVCRARAEAFREAAEAAVETVRRAEAQTAAVAAAAGWRERVEEVRRVFHRDAAPAAAVRACLDGLSVDLNRRLGHLAASFRVRMGEDGDLRADYHDGGRTRAVPADRLSGGEGAVLGLAWRLALLDRYAPKVGLLCLDEPTTGLDADRVSALRSALEAWRPHSAGRQFVVVTHERKLLSVFDAVVDLGAG